MTKRQVKGKGGKGRGGDFSMLSPWEIPDEQTCITKYCSDNVESLKFTQKDRNLPKIIDKKRSISTCANIRHKQKTQQIYHKIEQPPLFRPHFEGHLEPNHRLFHTISQQRTDKLEKRKATDRGNVLQQISVKNFIIEGGQSQTSHKQKLLKKRQSSFVLKQKFAEFRRSMKDVALQNKENANFRVIRYEN